jgi:osmoprotectant transport system permease protein
MATTRAAALSAPAIGGSGAELGQVELEQPSFWEMLGRQWSQVLPQSFEHLRLVLAAIAVSAVVGVAIGLLVYRTERPATLVLAAAGAFLTIPSFALIALFVPLLGLGFEPAWAMLLLYSLLPIVRNTVVGLRGVDPEIMESARGMGMRRWQQIARVELPLAWPVVLTGIRVATLLVVSIAAIAGVVSGPGLGNIIFRGLDRMGGVAAIPMVLAGTAGIIVVALLLDLVYLLIGAFTISRGLK